MKSTTGDDVWTPNKCKPSHPRGAAKKQGQHLLAWGQQRIRQPLKIPMELVVKDRKGERKKNKSGLTK